MAATADSSVSNGRARASGKIVIAGDRAASRLLAHRHSLRVRILKVALPVAALATVAVAAWMVLSEAGIGPALPEVDMPQIVADNLKMRNPHYEGFNGDGGRYWVRAETAQQDLKSLTVVHLEGITGELTDPAKRKTNLKAARGLFDNQTNILELYDSINVSGDSGLNAVLTHATIKTKEGIVTSDQPSTITMAAGRITSKQMTIRQKTKEYTFVDDVRAHMKPKEGTGAATPEAQQKQLPFGKPGEPVDIASKRLDIDDEKKTALFSGGVVATQAGSTMTTPEMTVTYEGAVAPQGGATDASPASEQSTKVKQIIGRDSVVLQQPTGETATSRSAVFDTSSQTAVLEGDVVLTQGADKRAVGDRAEYDQATQTMTLVGPVVVTQGPNVLKGRRLVFNRATNKLQLTAPSDQRSGGDASGRITAHFAKPAAKTVTHETNETQPSGDGIPFGASFKTDPNAPYDLTSDRLDVDDTARAAVFTGNVSAVQGDFTIRAQELTAFYTGSAGLTGSRPATSGGPAAAINHIEARRKVVVSSKDGQTATGDWAKVDVKSNLATLGGAVVLTQGKNIVRGTKLLIDMNTGEATIKTEPSSNGSGAMISSSDGDGSGQIVKADRPSAVFYPGQLTGKKSKSPQSDDGAWQAQTTP